MLTKDTHKVEDSSKQARGEAPEWIIENIAEASKNARNIFFIYASFLAYCVLTVVSTTDRRIILNETAKLPIINVEVSLTGFFITAPLVAIIVFVYFQLYINRIRGLVGYLHENYGSIERRRLYPWLLNIADDPEPGLVGKAQIWIVKISFWWSLPILLFLMTLWFAKKHDPILSYLLGIVSLFGSTVVLLFWCKYDGALLRGFARNHQGKIVLASIVFLVGISLLFVIIPRANEGQLLVVDLSYQSLITRPNQQDTYWLNLKGAHLEGANLTAVVAQRADLRGASLKNANFEGATLKNADLSNSDLRKANLRGANLEGANLGGAQLQEAKLSRAELRHANLGGANLNGAILADADLEGANLRGADLQQTDFREARLQGADLSTAELTEADFRVAQLRGADLRATYLQGANFDAADLQEVNFRSADLRGVLNLSIEQLSVVRTLHNAELDLEIKKQVEKDYPNLLKP